MISGAAFFILELLVLLTAIPWFQLFEEVIALVIYQDECREVLYFNLPDSFHTQFGIFYALDALDVVLCQDSSRTTDRAQVETTVLLAGIRHLLATVTFGKHNHAAAVALEEVYIRVHTSGSSRAHRTASHALRSLGGTGVVDRMILDVLRQIFATVQTLFQFGMCNVAAYDDGSVQRQTGRNRILSQHLQDVGHRLVQVNLYNVAFASLAKFGGNQFARVAVQLLNPDTFAIDFTLDVTVGRAGNTQTNGAGSTVTRQTNDANIVSQVLAAELCTDCLLYTSPSPRDRG